MNSSSNFSPENFGAFLLQGFSPPPSPKNSRPKLSAFLSNLTFLKPICFSRRCSAYGGDQGLEFPKSRRTRKIKNPEHPQKSFGESLRGNRIGATGLRASERKSASERVSEREGLERFLRGFESFSEVFRVFLEVFRDFLEVFRGPLRGRFPLRGSQSCCP